MNSHASTAPLRRSVVVCQNDPCWRDPGLSRFLAEIRRRIGLESVIWSRELTDCSVITHPDLGGGHFVSGQERPSFIFIRTAGLEKCLDEELEYCIGCLTLGGLLGGDGFLSDSGVAAIIRSRFATVQQDGDRWVVASDEVDAIPEPLLLGEALIQLLGDEKEVRYIPNPGNSGDAVIARGTKEVFDRIGLKLNENSHNILVAGGGNLVPFYGDLRRTLNSLPRFGLYIILMPCTAVDCFDLLKEFENLVILARELYTFKAARIAGVPTMLCHDAAFEVDYSAWSDRPDRDTRPFLRNFRIDCEAAGHPYRDAYDNRDLSEEHGNELWSFPSAFSAAERFISDINRYQVVQTDRLHVGIVAACLGKTTRIYPNSYHKNQSIFTNSLRAFSYVTFVDPARWPRAAGFDSFEEYVSRFPARWLEIDPASDPLEAPTLGFGDYVDFGPLTGPALPPGGVLRLDGVLVRGRDGLIETATGERLIDLAWPSHIRAPSLHYWEGEATLEFEELTLTLLSPWAYANYAHFLLEVLGRIAFLKAAGIDFNAFTRIFLPRPPSQFASEMLRRTGIPECKIHWVANDAVIKVHHLIVPSFPGAARVYNWRGLSYVKSLGSDDSSPLGKRIFVDRGGQSRDLINRDEVLDLLAKAGFDVFNERWYGHADVIFRNADSVIGLHGAGMANLVFCEAGTKVLEVVPSAWPAPFYRSIAVQMELSYACIKGTSQGHNDLPNSKFLHAPMSLDIESLRAALMWLC